MPLEAQIEIEQLGGGWWSKVSARNRGVDLCSRAKEFRANTYSALFEDIATFLDSVVPREPVPAKQPRANRKAVTA
jgi:hypothetical protein